jgi:ectoine hydroxylase-related dioxygenase (phytanoyl-CoA dioxygenase family)
MTPDAQTEYFQTNGYLNRGAVLTAAEVEDMRAGLDRVIAQERGGGDNSSVEFKYGHDRVGDAPDESGRDARAIHQYVNMWKRDPAYEAAIHNPHIVETARNLLGTPTVRLWHDQIISKPPGDNAHFGFHQDFYFWPISPANIVSCWLALDDATVDSGCMHVIPASHADPRFTPDAHARDAEAARKARDEGQPAPKFERDLMGKKDATHGVPVELKAGECMFHHCLNFHCTPPNVTDNQRRAFVMIFMADGVLYDHAKSPSHILVPTIEVADGEPLVGDAFPVA